MSVRKSPYPRSSIAIECFWIAECIFSSNFFFPISILFKSFRVGNKSVCKFFVFHIFLHVLQHILFQIGVSHQHVYCSIYPTASREPDEIPYNVAVENIVFLPARSCLTVIFCFFSLCDHAIREELSSCSCVPNASRYLTIMPCKRRLRISSLDGNSRPVSGSVSCSRSHSSMARRS